MAFARTPVQLLPVAIWGPGEATFCPIGDRRIGRAQQSTTVHAHHTAPSTLRRHQPPRHEVEASFSVHNNSTQLGVPQGNLPPGGAAHGTMRRSRASLVAGHRMGGHPLDHPVPVARFHLVVK